MEEPQIGNTLIAKPVGVYRKKDVIATQTVNLLPESRYLAKAVTLVGEDGKDLAQAVPLEQGALITRWRSGLETRDCSIGWKNGLFGGAAGEGHYRWICFEDSNGDGRYDLAYRTKSKNMGLSYSRLDIPLAEPVATIAAIGTEKIPQDELSALGAHDLDQTLSLLKIKKDTIRLRLDPINRRSREEIDIANEAGASGEIGGFRVEVVEPGKDEVRLKIEGQFEDPETKPFCDGTGFSLAGMSMRTGFAFPNW